MNRLARIRSDVPASQPCAGRAQWRVGSIEDDGIRYGLTTHAFSPRTTRPGRATGRVRIQSTTDRWRRERFGKRRSSGPRTRGSLRCGSGDGRDELAADQLDRVQVGVREVLEHHALEGELLERPEAFDDAVDGADGPALAVALDHRVAVAS